MKTKHLLACMAIMLGSVALSAAEPGTTCYTAIPLGKEYKADITGSQTVWYSAWTFDLPLAVYFMPQNENDPAPEVEMDFSCTTGVYSDSILCSLFCPNSESGIQIDMPHKPKLKTDVIDGKLVYYIAMGKDYRDLLLRMGISYNVEVFVKVTYKSKGTISIAPDDMFSGCMDGAKFMQFGDTVRVKANDKERFFVVPYVQWQEDSIYYIWSGNKKAEVTVATDCKHNPDAEAMDESVLQRLKIPAGDTVKVSSERIKHYVQFGEAGMLFAKCVSSSDGVLTIKRVPQAPPRGGAKLLKYGQRVILNANDTNALYAIPSSWDTATICTAPTDHIFRMYIGTGPDFYTKDAIAAYQFHPSDKGHWLGVLTEEMKALWVNSTEHYLYVRFACSARTTFLAEIWNPSECMNKKLITKQTTTIDVQKASYGAVFYRFYYNDWRGGDLTFTWNLKSGNCPAFIGDTCYFSASASDPHVFANKAIPKNGSWTVTAEELDAWAEHVDPDGYFYIRFNPTNAGKMDISTTAPDETDPVYPHATIHVECQDGNPNVLTVTVSEPQHISVTVTGTGEVSEEWDATVDAPHPLNLPAGQYSLKGANEEIVLLVP
ncbi:MAG: hypothetical protein IKO26_01400 [Paludibacteraceae bacterium]|nr:hypothetical protein [Paludibacteraceae bacterium]